MLSNSQPVIKILKRPPNLVSPEQVNGLNSCNVKPQPVVKSLQQVIRQESPHFFYDFIVLQLLIYSTERIRIC